MSDKSLNIERTAAYLENFNREKVLKYLIRDACPAIIDVGANEGNTIREFKAWWPKASIHAFEPQQECWQILDEMAEKFQSVVINKYALGNNQADEVAFYSHGLTSGQSGFNKINMASRDSINLNQLRTDGQDKMAEYEAALNHARAVSMRRLDHYAREQSITRIDLLKIDTQGFEPEVLEGAGKFLGNTGVVITELMFYDFYERSLSFTDIEKYLLPAGFILYDINHISKNPMNGRTDWVDVIYVNNKKLTGN
jgi:FkbM family methyltransferase